MSNRPLVQRADGGPLTGPRCGRFGRRPSTGISRRTLLRRSIGLGFGLWLAEVTAGSVSFLWSAVGSEATKVQVGTLDAIASRRRGPPVHGRLPGVHPGGARIRGRGRSDVGTFLPGSDPRRRGASSTCAPCPRSARTSAAARTRASRTSGSIVRATSRATIASGSRRRASCSARRVRAWIAFAVEVDANGMLTIDSDARHAGPLPIALGQPGLIPPLPRPTGPQDRRRPHRGLQRARYRVVSAPRGSGATATSSQAHPRGRCGSSPAIRLDLRGAPSMRTSIRRCHPRSPLSRR